MTKVIMYSTPTCEYCAVAKDFLEGKGVKVTVYDVSIDKKRNKELVEKSEQTGVPVFEINKEIIVGFDQAKIIELLKL